eukprot:11160500-Lingulodinium_polyedra.AAC.1
MLSLLPAVAVVAAVVPPTMLMPSLRSTSHRCRGCLFRCALPLLALLQHSQLRLPRIDAAAVTPSLPRVMLLPRMPLS